MTAPVRRLPAFEVPKSDDRSKPEVAPRVRREPSERLARLMDGVSAVGALPANFGVD